MLLVCNTKIRSYRHPLSAFCSISAVKKLNPSPNKWAQGLPSTSTCWSVCPARRAARGAVDGGAAPEPWEQRPASNLIHLRWLLKSSLKGFWRGRSQRNQPLPAATVSCVSLVLIQDTLLLKKSQASPKLFLSRQSHLCSHPLVSQEKFLTLNLVLFLYPPRSRFWGPPWTTPTSSCRSTTPG